MLKCVSTHSRTLKNDFQHYPKPFSENFFRTPNCPRAIFWKIFPKKTDFPILTDEHRWKLAANCWLSEGKNPMNLQLGRMVEVFSTSSSETDLQSGLVGSVHLTPNPSLSAGVGLYSRVLISVAAPSLINSEDNLKQTLLQFILHLVNNWKV